MAVLCPFVSKEQGLRSKDFLTKSLLLLTAVLCLFSGPLMAQDLKPLKVGDKLPETFWQQEHTIYADGQVTKQTLAQYKGKLLILDFWATWCSSCLQKFAGLGRLQNAHDVAVVLVSKTRSDKDSEKVKQSFDRYAKGTGLSTVVGDEYLGRLFPHWQLPFYVWINAKGYVMAFSDSNLVNEASVAQVLNGKAKQEVAP